jgi:hypothetical protein
MSLNNFVLLRLGHFPLDVPHVVAGVFLLTAAAGAIRNRRALPSGALARAAAAFCVVPLLALVFPHLAGFSYGAFWRSYAHLVFLVLVFLAIGSCQAGDLFPAILRTVAVAGLANAVLGLWQAFAVPRGLPTGIALANRFVYANLRGSYLPIWRATALFEEPRWLAMYLLFACCYCFALARRCLEEGRRRCAAGWLLALLVVAGGVVATGSLGGIPALIVLFLALSVSLLKTMPRHRGLASLALAAVLLAGVAFASRSNEGILSWFRFRLRTEAVTPLANTPLTRGFSSAGLYVDNARYALAVWSRSPLFGIGPGQFAPVASVTGKELGFRPEATRDGPWVGWAGFLAEYGLAGAGIAAILGVLLCRPARGPGGDQTLACLLVLVVLLTETFSGFYVQFWTWFPLGIAALSVAPGRRTSAA